LEGLQEVAWATNQIGWGHYQVGGSSGRPDPLVGDDHELGWWGPRGTHVSQVYSAEATAQGPQNVEDPQNEDTLIVYYPMYSFFTKSGKNLSKIILTPIQQFISTTTSTSASLMIM
jgi:hypothetical protein